jgi:hypothetical protein
VFEVLKELQSLAGNTLSMRVANLFRINAQQTLDMSLILLFGCLVFNPWRIFCLQHRILNMMLRER